MKKTLLLLSALFLAVALNAQNGPYGIKSGHLKYENQTSGGTQYNELWFDDYGLLRKQHDQIMMEGMGNYHTEILMRDNKIYSSAWFDDERTNEAGMTEGFPDLNFMNPSEQFKKDSHRIRNRCASETPRTRRVRHQVSGGCPVLRRRPRTHGYGTSLRLLFV